MKTKRRFMSLIVMLVLILADLGNTSLAGARPLVTDLNIPPFDARDASQFNAQVPLAWFDLAYSLVRDEALSPPVASRIFGYLGVALYEALVPGMPGYQTLAGQLNDLPTMPKPADLAYYWPTVANSALATTMEKLLTAESSSTQIHALEEQFVREFKPGLPPGVYKRSVERGETISQAIIQWAASDGYQSYKDCPYLPPTGAGLWVPTPPRFRSPNAINTLGCCMATIHKPSYCGCACHQPARHNCAVVRTSTSTQERSQL